ncbi:MAG: hypothetical protein VR69_03220 [Peptococcaceae bacterium BRH_c4b]|nr:MAG: hypothetical protein VR69_03220 [Peptococcaceae bacterium BRH_c4b]
MVFSSLTFLLVFLPLVLLLYYISKNRVLRNIILFIFSLIFYSWGEPVYVLLLLASIIINYSFGLFIDKFRGTRKTKCFFIILIIFNITLLGFFKYVNFIIENFNLIFSLRLESLNLALPIGISFYTFQILSYIIDLYRNKIKVQRNILSLGLYVTLFPKLILGPIVRYSTIEHELINRQETLDNFVAGLRRFLLGLTKKVLIANQVSHIVSALSEQGIENLDVTFSWLMLIAFAIQIYFDFSGYSDMAIGLGKMFGFNFTENFNYPYISNSITDFWRRWHISLSSWFRDYVYIPLGGNRVKQPQWIFNLFTVWTLTGLWHGASWNFVLWGMYWFVFLLLEKKMFLKILDKLPKLFQWIYATFFILIGWAIFMTDTNNPLDILAAIKGLFGAYNENCYITFWDLDMATKIPFLVLGIIFSFPFKKYLDKFFDGKWMLAYDTILIAQFALCIFFLMVDSYNPFLYFRF